MSQPYSKGGPHRPPIAAKDSYSASTGGAPRRRPPIGAGVAPTAGSGPAPSGAPPRSGRPPISSFQPPQQYQAYNPQFQYGGAPLMAPQSFFPSGMYQPPAAAGAPLMGAMYGAPTGAPVASGPPAGVPPVAASKGPVISKPPTVETSGPTAVSVEAAPSRPPAASRRPPVVSSQPPTGVVPPQFRGYPPTGAPMISAAPRHAAPSGAPEMVATRPPISGLKPPVSGAPVGAPVGAPIGAPVAAAPVAVAPVISAAAAVRTEAAPAEAKGAEVVAEAPPAVKRVEKPKIWLQFTGAAKKDPVFASWAAQIRYSISGDAMKLALHKPPAKMYEVSKIVLFTLEGIRTPRLPRRGKDGDLFGYEARAFLRTTVSKRPVHFCVWRAIKESTRGTTAPWRYFGDIYFHDDNRCLQSLSQLMVANGWAEVKLREGIPAAEWSLNDAEYSTLQKLQAKAKAAKIGRWAEVRPPMRVVKDVVQKKENRAFFRRHEKKTVTAVVEKALSGSMFRVEIIPTEAGKPYESVLVHLAGANCSRPDAKLDQPYAHEAMDWAEAKVLNETVQITFLAIDRKDNLYVDMSHPRGKLAEVMLRHGMATYEAWTAMLTPPPMQKKLLEAVKFASDNHINLYQHKAFKEQLDEFPATVTQVLSGDTLLVTTEAGDEIRYLLASIRSPRRLPRDFSADRKPRDRGGDETKSYYEPKPDDRVKEAKFTFEAKQFVRHLVAGKQVTVKVEYDRAMDDGAVLKYASVFVGSTNVAVALLKEGLATVIKHRKDEAKSVHYKDLQDAEDASKRAKKGMFGTVLPTPPIDLTSNVSQKLGVHELVQLNHSIVGKTMTAVVEYVFRGDRIKLFLPKQNVIIVVSLSGIRCDQSVWSNDATDHMRRRVFQRDVELKLESVNVDGATSKKRRRRAGRGSAPPARESSKRRSPQYFGHVLVTDTGKRQAVNVAHELVSMGLVKVQHRRERREVGRGRTEFVDITDPALLELEAKAMADEIGLWKEEGKRLAEADAARRAKFQTGVKKTVQTSYVGTAASFWVIETANFAVMDKVTEMLSTMSPTKVVRPRIGNTVAALFDGQYARARIERQSQDRDNAFLVLFLDYGNRTTVAARDMALLPEELSLSSIEPLAHRCVLAGLRTPPRSTHMHIWRDAGKYFASMAMSQNLECHVLYDDFDDRKWYGHLTNAKGDSINKQMVAEGLLRTDPKHLDTPDALYGAEAAEETGAYLKEVEALEKEAFTKMKAMWAGGEVADD